MKTCDSYFELVVNQNNSDCLNRFYSKKFLKPPFYVLTEKLTVKNGYKKT